MVTSNRRHESVLSRRAVAVATLDGCLFTAAEARAAGLTINDLRSDAVVALRRNVYVTATTPITLGLRCGAALRVTKSDARVAHVTAARLWGLPVPETHRLHLSYERRPNKTLVGTIAHRHPAASLARSVFVAGVGRLPVSDPTGVVTECADSLGLVDLVVLADAVLSRHDVDAGRAIDVWKHGAGPHSAALREVARRAREGAESPPESRTRLLLVLAGLPEPVVQHEAFVAGRRRRFDLAYPELKIAVEYDGSYHYASEAQKQADIVREDELRSAGWIVIRVVSVGIFRDPASTLARVADALTQRGVKVAPNTAWRQHFVQLAPVA
ncbi:DUF559 domain-containing protein [Dermacoccus sp. 147Ba]|uniref:endonuclease domain-containing protein n=1 Tax=Dermacoccus sp. 147Ba TaxID=2510111 RepID=UPI00101DA15D|nr:DUF559 domain-containing protein [Dermacoccus sp. 147Ba]RYI22392.1 DUF559 domain-containing protein [Dermacoccus sp. 147Ba]